MKVHAFFWISSATLCSVLLLALLCVNGAAAEPRRGGGRVGGAKLGKLFWNRQSRGRETRRRQHVQPPPPPDPPAKPRNLPPTAVGSAAGAANAPPPPGWNVPPHQQKPPAYSPHQPYPGYYPTSNVGVVPPRGANHGQYYNSMGGMGNMNHLWGGYGYGAMKKPGGGGLFGQNAFRNVMGGLFIWYMISGLTRRPYNVYNYYNQPPNGTTKFELPPNVLTVCNENASSVCVPGTTAICTQNETIFCVTPVSTTKPCAPDSPELCFNATVPCNATTDNNNNCTTSNGTESPTQLGTENIETANNTAGSAVVDVPCLTKLTILADETTQGDESNGGQTMCVTSMAVPGEEEKITSSELTTTTSEPQLQTTESENSTANVSTESTELPNSVVATTETL